MEEAKRQCGKPDEDKDETVRGCLPLFKLRSRLAERLGKKWYNHNFKTIEIFGFFVRPFLH